MSKISLTLDSEPGVAMISPAISHMIPESFQNPERFDPERFAPPREEHKRTNYALIGFGGGKHRCIGMAFAYLQVRAIMSYLLRHFELELVSREPRPDYSGFVIGPIQPCLVRYRRRQPLAQALPTDPATTAATQTQAPSAL